MRWGAACAGEAEAGESPSVYDGEWVAGRRRGLVGFGLGFGLRTLTLPLPLRS